MKSTSLVSAIVLSILVLLPAKAFAGAEQNNGVWMMTASQGILGTSDSPYRWWFDAHARYSDDANDFEQSILRPGVGYSLGNNHTVFLGYGWIGNSPEIGDEFYEHRVWQQHSWTTSFDGFGFSSRSRLEQRFMEGRGGETGWRFRQNFKLTHPLGTNTRFYWSIWDEVFLNLNDTDWGANNGLDRNRIFAGIGWKPNSLDYCKAEVGYLNQFIYRESATDRMDHLLSLNVFFNF